MKRTTRILLLVFFSLLLLVSAWKIIDIQTSYRVGENSYSSLKQYISLPEASPVPIETDTPPTTETTWQQPQTEPVVTDDTVWPIVDFEALREINPDIVGWIYIEGTDISYPVVQGKDNSYYLKRLFDGSYNSSGCIFLDSNCPKNFTAQHSIIYGHNMRNDTMFAGLMEYKEQSYFDEHPVALLLTPTRKYKIMLFSGYIANPSSNAWRLDFSDGTFEYWLANIAGRSGFVSDIYPTEDDQIATLSTCTYEYDGALFVLHGILRDCGEYGTT